MLVSVFCAFFISGFCALALEVVWSRMLTLVFGASVYGQSIVLGLFMGGMALGAHWVGKRIGQARYPLFWYGLLEGVVAIFGLATLALIPLAENLSFGSPQVDFLTHIIMVALIIVPATFAMGGTFPVLYRVLTDVGEPGCDRSLLHVSNLYLFNTIGALTGIAACNYLLLATLGMTATVFIAVTLNAVLSAYFILRRHASPSRATVPQPDEQKPPEPRHRMILGALFLSGFATMMYEISWSRAINFSFGSSTFTFSLVIFSFIFGLGLGTAWIRKKTLQEREKRILCTDLQTWLVLFVALFVFVAARIPTFAGTFFELCQGVYWRIHVLEVLLLILLISPVAFLIGASFPLLVTLVVKNGQPSESAVGTAYSINTWGAIVGALMSGFLLVPLVGPFQTIWIGFTIHGLMIVCVAPRAYWRRASTNAAMFLVVITFTILQLNLFDHRDLMRGSYSRVFKSSGDYIPKFLRENADFWRTSIQHERAQASPYDLLWFEHGLTSSVAVMKNNLNTKLIIDGKTDASVGAFSASDMPTQSFLGLLPILYAPTREKGLIVGYGSGVTTGIAAQYTRTVDSLEIEQAVIDASPFFGDYNFQAETLPNVNIVVGDARKFIREAEDQYDYISAEPSNIWVAGVAHLFTVDYFEDCRRILKDGGLIVQWLHIYKLSARDFKTAVNTFSTVFESFEIWGSYNFGDIILIGWKDPRRTLDRATFDEVMDAYVFREELARIGADDYDGFLSYRLTTPPSMLQELRRFPTHTDDLPVLEYSAARNMFVMQKKEIYQFLGQ